MNVSSLSLVELVNGLRSREFCSVEITEAYLERIERFEPSLNSFITVCAEEALDQAGAADLRLAEDGAPLLTGVPIAMKDIFCTRGIRTTCGSRMLETFAPPYDATVVELLDTAGAVMIGKTNMDEFAMGSSNETSYFGPTRNPWDMQRVAGGSSGGSAAAVAARLSAAATGTDTGGSIRQPAAFCGITGIKPTYGRVSRYGMIAYASSFDQGGAMGQSAADVAVLLGAMAAFDPRDSTSVEHPEEDYSKALDKPLAGIKIGVPREYFGSELDRAIGEKSMEALAVLERTGARLEEIRLPHYQLAIPSYYVLALAECSSNLSRFDGIRFGYRCAQPKDLLDLYCRSRAEGFGDEVKRRIMIGTYALSAGYYDAYYIQAQRIRRLVRDDFLTALETVDVIAAPTAPTTAFPLGEKLSDPVEMYLSDLYTTAANLAGLPALSMPIGLEAQLPVGLQLIGNYFDESRLLNVAHQYQQETRWHRELPGLETPL